MGMRATRKGAHPGAPFALRQAMASMPMAAHSSCAGP
jgi:hypothetical protein